MAEKKEKAPHEKIIDNMYSKKKAMDSYIFSTKFEHEDVLHTAKSTIINKLGAEKAYEHLKTAKGHEEFGELGSKRLEELALSKYGIDKSKVHEFDLTRLVESTYGINKNILKSFMQDIGPEFDFSDYKENFLNKHLEQVQSHILTNHIMNYDSSHTPATLKHIGADKYFKDPSIFKDDKYKPHILNTVLTWDKGKQPIGENYFTKNKDFSLFIKDQYRDK